jgi:hypothetical protein
MSTTATRLEAAELIRRLLAHPDLEATTPPALALVRRLEGAAAALEVSAISDRDLTPYK